jgi:hypothetical protein
MNRQDAKHGLTDHDWLRMIGAKFHERSGYHLWRRRAQKLADQCGVTTYLMRGRDGKGWMIGNASDEQAMWEKGFAETFARFEPREART